MRHSSSRTNPSDHPVGTTSHRNLHRSHEAHKGLF